MKKLSRIFENYLGSSMSLRRKAIFSSNWMIIQSFMTGILDLAKTAIFARVLFPADYGLMALATVAIGLLESFSVLGIEVMILREHGEKYLEKLSVYWTLRLYRGVILAALSWFVAIPMAEYYDKPELLWLIRFLGITFLLNGISLFGREVLQRRMHFKKVAVAESLTSICTLGIGLLFLFYLKNVWALAVYLVIYALFRAITSFILFPWRPRFQVEKSIIKGVAIFAVSIIAVNIMNYFFGNFDRMVVGKYMGIEKLGFYARAHFLALIPVTYVANVIAPVFLPAFRNVADDPDRFRLLRAFVKVLTAYFFSFSAMGIGLFLFARIFILIIYGDRWLQVLPVFKILVIYASIKGISTIIPMVFFVKGRPWLNTLCSGILVICFCILCVPFTKTWGMEGTAWSVVISGFISSAIALIISLFLLCKHGQDKKRKSLKPISNVTSSLERETYDFG